MKTYRIKYFLIAAVSLVMSFAVEKKNLHRLLPGCVAGCVVSFFLRTDPDIYDVPGIGMIVLGLPAVYLISLTDKKNMYCDKYEHTNQTKNSRPRIL
jgi:Ca2+/Na+ antiporter